MKHSFTVLNVWPGDHFPQVIIHPYLALSLHKPCHKGTCLFWLENPIHKTYFYSSYNNPNNTPNHNQTRSLYWEDFL